MKKYSRVCARIDLDTVKHNIENIHASLTPETQMMLVLKADGYGHGALPIARLAEVESFVWGFALATVEEAVFLRRNGIQKPLLTLGCLFSENYEDVIKHDIQVMIYQLEEARALSKCAVAMKKKVSIHIKLDTGMGRIGFETTKENIVRIQEIHALPNLNLLGLATHFAKADEEDKTFTNKQIERFIWIRDALQENNIAFPYTHLANSAAVLDMKHSHMDLVRVGIAIHGLYPSESVNHEEVILEPTLSLNSRVSYVKWVEADTPIGYGGTYITKKKSRIVTVPVGYADGYPRSLSNKGKVLIRGKKLPIIGRICMDYLMVDATHLAKVELGDIVTLIGEQQGERITVAELGALSERFPYEFVCDLSKRIPREYLQNNQVVEQIDYL